MRRSLFLVVAWLVFFAPVSCAPKPEPREPIIVGKATCSQACENARKVCDATYLKPRTGTCEEACSNAEANAMDFRTTCLANARSCSAAKDCSKR